ncbi:MAG: lycopene cyclase domain-containing protein [Candidatus Nanosyncoccaceae bacterium]|jgi:hypothetical protein
MEKYFYLVGVLLVTPLWLIMFLRSSHRKDMALFGAIFGLAAIFLEALYSKLDYWNPSFAFPVPYVEDFLYGFIFGGISTEIAEFLMGKINSKKPTHPIRLWFFLIFATMTWFFFVWLVHIMGLNSIWAHILPPLMVGVIISIIRRDLFRTSFLSGLIVMAIAFLMLFVLKLIFTTPVFHAHWQLDNLLGVFVLEIPIEELLFTFALGFGAANVYEFIFGYSLVKDKPKKKSAQKRVSRSRLK